MVAAAATTWLGVALVRVRGLAFGLRISTIVHVDGSFVGCLRGGGPRSPGAFLRAISRYTAVDRTVLRSRGVLRISSVNCVSVDLDRTRPIWRQIAAIVQARIEDGTYPAGSRVPSVVELSTEFEVAASTAQKVLGHLKESGWVRSEVGLGTFVSDQPPKP